MNGGSPEIVVWFLVLAPILIVVIWIAATYNRLVNLRNLIRDSWANIDTELRRRYDLIPNLVDTVKAYAAHERAVIESVTQARTRAMSSAGSSQDRIGAENDLGKSLKSLFAVSEAYPDLKASQNFLDLQHELVNTEDRIQAARRFYNGNVRDYNNVTDWFPSCIVASVFGLGHEQYFDIEDAIAREVVSIKNEMDQAAGGAP